METIRLHKIIEKDGEILVTGLPYRKGQRLEMILLPESPSTYPKPRLTAIQLLRSELVGLWKDREDIEDSADYARQLREQVQKRDDPSGY
ncbi:hypothetical protein ACFL6S_29790 [Candidatus Poribacteria bacterium]